MKITAEIFEKYKGGCPVICQGIQCCYTNCPMVYWINKAKEKK